MILFKILKTNENKTKTQLKRTPRVQKKTILYGITWMNGRIQMNELFVVRAEFVCLT